MEDTQKTIEELEVIISGLKDQIDALQTQNDAFRGQDEARQKEELHRNEQETKLSERLKAQMKIDGDKAAEHIKVLENQVAGYKVMEVEFEKKMKQVIDDANKRIQLIFNGLSSLNNLILATFKNFQGALDNATDLYAFISKQIDDTAKEVKN